MTTEAGRLDAQRYRRVAAASRAVAGDLLVSPTVLARGLDPAFRVRPHARIIGQELVDLEAGRSDRLMIFTPPQLGKSTLATEWGSFWWLCLHPTHRIIATSYGDDLAERRGRNTRGHVIEHGHEFELELSKAKATQQEWDLATGGGMRSVSMGSGVTGHSADLFIIDDPHKDRADSRSHRSREAVWEWYTSTALTRLQPGSPMILIMTRWDEDDLAGRLLKQEGRADQGGRWRVVHIPAIADPGRFGSDPLGREQGQPLAHPKIPMAEFRVLVEHWADRKRSAGVRDWHSMYQGDPRPVEGALVSYDLLRDIRQYEPWPEPQKIAVAVDPSGGGRDTAGVIGGFLGGDGRMWITHDRSEVMSSAQWSLAACQLAVDTDAQIIVVEKNYGGDLAKLAIRSAWEKLQREHVARVEVERRKAETAGRSFEAPPDPYAVMPRLVEMTAKTGKRLRAEPIAQQMIFDRVRLGGYMPDLEQEWATWQEDDPMSPGRIDASALLGYALLKIPGASKAFGVAKVSREQVGSGQGGVAGARIDRRQ